MKSTILLIEGKRADHPSFGPGLRRKGFQVESAANGSAAIARLESVDPDLVIVDAASLRTSGRRICLALREELDGLPIVLIVDVNKDVSTKVEADVVLSLPFTVQKLINRMKPYLPAEEKNILHVGPIRMDIEQRRVRCLSKKARLTPKEVLLLKTLMEHPGEAIERKTLFKSVWETEYTGDTRTLDVHISWLREAIEPNPRQPRFLKTIRGVGYRLDV
ncbi:MAG: response regulator transcription factor [Chloroflexi bacterium]|nr:response regulator transcription factor [Chloroflexota bacterium]